MVCPHGSQATLGKRTRPSRRAESPRAIHFAIGLLVVALQTGMYENFGIDNPAGQGRSSMDGGMDNGMRDIAVRGIERKHRRG